MNIDIQRRYQEEKRELISWSQEASETYYRINADNTCGSPGIQLFGTWKISAKTREWSPIDTFWTHIKINIRRISEYSTYQKWTIDSFETGNDHE